MKALNRRDFLRVAFLRAHGAEAAAAAGAREPDSAPPAKPGEGWLSIGRIADFPVGEIRALPEAGLAIESLPQGLRARSLTDPAAFHAIAAGPDGRLLACRGEKWPGDKVYSTLISGPAGLETGTEEDG